MTSTVALTDSASMSSGIDIETVFVALLSLARVFGRRLYWLENEAARLVAGLGYSIDHSPANVADSVPGRYDSSEFRT
ncbi:MAG: hypothetical protein NC336_02170 [Clostridium sp.]|nr:hypothetical protein [Clostridium sp.]